MVPVADNIIGAVTAKVAMAGLILLLPGNVAAVGAGAAQLPFWSSSRRSSSPRPRRNIAGRRCPLPRRR